MAELGNFKASQEIHFEPPVSLSNLIQFISQAASGSTEESMVMEHTDDDKLLLGKASRKPSSDVEVTAVPNFDSDWRSKCIGTIIVSSTDWAKHKYDVISAKPAQTQFQAVNNFAHRIIEVASETSVQQNS